MRVPPLTLKDAAKAGEPIREEVGVALGAEEQSEALVTSR